jgi:hypothetical protein
MPRRSRSTPPGSLGSALPLKSSQWEDREIAGKRFRSVADIVDPETRDRVRDYKKHLKAGAKAGAP